MSEVEDNKVIIIIGESPYTSNKDEVNCNAVYKKLKKCKKSSNVSFWRKQLRIDHALVRILTLLLGDENVKNYYKKNRNKDTTDLIDKFSEKNIFFLNVYKDIDSKTKNSKVYDKDIVDKICCLKDENTNILVCTSKIRVATIKELKKLETSNEISIYRIIHPSARGGHTSLASEMWDLYLYKEDINAKNGKNDIAYSSSEKILETFRLSDSCIKTLM